MESLSGFMKKKMHVIILKTGYSEPPYFGFLRGRSPVLTTACQSFCLDCVMVIKTAFFFLVVIMNIVTSVRVYPQEGTVETVSKFHLSCPVSASNLV